jgi:hypothetical protein
VWDDIRSSFIKVKAKMIKVSIILHSVLREKLPPESKGRTVLVLPDGAQVADVIRQLQLPENALFALNEQIERDPQKVLCDQDCLRFFRGGGGG